VTSRRDGTAEAPGPEGALFHIAEPADWDAAGPHYRVRSLDTEGFIHLSAAHQVRATTARHYGGRAGLLLLVIDPLMLEQSELRWEVAAHGEAFPHLHGPLPVSAVTETRPWPPPGELAAQRPHQTAAQPPDRDGS
jgi:uncharacterized protein (DUF952 family)